MYRITTSLAAVAALTAAVSAFIPPVSQTDPVGSVGYIGPVNLFHQPTENLGLPTDYRGTNNCLNKKILRGS